MFYMDLRSAFGSPLQATLSLFVIIGINLIIPVYIVVGRLLFVLWETRLDILGFSISSFLLLWFLLNLTLIGVLFYRLPLWALIAFCAAITCFMNWFFLPHDFDIRLIKLKMELYPAIYEQCAKTAKPVGDKGYFNVCETRINKTPGGYKDTRLDIIYDSTDEISFREQDSYYYGGKLASKGRPHTPEWHKVVESFKLWNLGSYDSAAPLGNHYYYFLNESAVINSVF